MRTRFSKGAPWLIGVVFMALISLPYLYAWQAAGPEHVFGGFLLNPLDGNTYLAKILAGYNGAWRYRMAFTAEPGDGAYLFVFYLSLGHLARFLGITPLLTFHLARLAGALVLLWSLYRFLRAVLPEPRLYRTAFLLAALGAGMGWLAVPFGGFTSDFWVAEAYPFLSAYATPHFGLGLALLLFHLTPGKPGLTIPRAIAWLAAGALLALIAPFGVVVALVVYAGLAVWDRLAGEISRSRATWMRVWYLPRSALVALAGLPILAYDLWVARADPVLAGWNAQNQTPSPPWWDLLLSFLPFLLLAVWGAAAALRRRDHGPARLLLVWAISGLVLMYVPWSLQRRFMLGLLVPLAGLAALGVERLAAGRPGRFRALALGALLLTLPTTLILLLTAVYGARTREPALYLTRSEAAALEWVSANTPPEALILAAPDTGTFIPAHSGRRVIYGHPFETVNAEVEEQAVLEFFQGLRPGFIYERRVDYVWVGPRERKIGVPAQVSGLPAVYSLDGVTLYAVSPGP